MTTFHVTSDTHFGHRNIFKDGYCPGRQDWMTYPSIEEHDDALVEYWNTIVKPGDTVIHLGDFAFGTAATVRAYRQSLHGTLWLVLGNHDRGLQSMRQCCAREPADYVGYGFRLKMYLGSACFTVACRHMPTVGAEGRFGFTKEDETEADFLWHGHTHNRAYTPPTPKHVAWGIDVRPEQRITTLPGQFDIQKDGLC